MCSDRQWGAGPLAVAGLGVLLVLTATAHHATEIESLGAAVGPLLALALDGVPALGLVYAGWWLRRADLDADHRWAVAVWSFGGVTLFTSVVGLTMSVRLFEGRSVSEPTFTLLVAAVFGGLAGVLAGYYRVRAVADAARAEQASDTLAFVNSLIRHDLRNDMQVIRGYAAEIEDRDPESAEAADHAAIVRRKADEAFERIEATGSLARTVAGDGEFEPVDLASAVADVAADLDRTTEATVRTDLPDRAPVTANAGLRSVVDNLAENAVEHNDADEPRVWLTVERDGAHTRLTVRDNGPGIPADERPSAYRAGERTEGGGLRIATTLVDRYGGDLRVADRDADGSTVVVDLPSAADGSDPPPAAASASGD